MTLYDQDELTPLFCGICGEHVTDALLPAVAVCEECELAFTNENKGEDE